MKKFLFTLVLALLVIVGVLPYWFGVEAERIFYEQLKQIEGRGNITITASSFDRGWLRSESTTTVLLNDSDLLVEARHTLEHGPFPASDPLKYLIALRPLQALIRSTLSASSGGNRIGSDNLGRLITTVNIEGSTSTAVNLAAASMQLDRQGVLAWQPVSGTVDFRPVNEVWRGELHLSGMDWTSDEAGFVIGPSVFTFESYFGNTGLAMGNSTLVSDTLNARFPGPQGAIDAQGVVIISKADQQDQNLTYSMSGRFEQVNVSDLDLGQGNWNLSATDLDVDAMTRLNSMDVGSAIPLNELILLVTKRKAKLQTTLEAATGSGQLTAIARLSIAGDSNTTNPFLLIGALEGEANVDIPADVVDLAARSNLSVTSGVSPERIPKAAADAKAQSWVDNNILVRSDDAYHFQASINKGAIKVNKKPINLLSLLTR